MYLFINALYLNTIKQLMNNTKLTQIKIMKRLILFIPFLLVIFCVSAQERIITGKVVERGSGAPVIGASVINQETKKGASTDINGSFTISAQTGQRIKVAYLGFADAIEKLAATDNTLTIRLEASISNLQEVVVTGYQTEKRKDIAGAVSVVNVGEIKKMPNNNPIQALQGRVPGMIVTTDGSPSGANTMVQIRGMTSINGSGNVPLLVIDGVPTKGGMHELNPNDIESMQVLKDASAASIYGSRASAGVIIITTKRAKNGESKVTANVRNSYSYYQNRMEVLDAEGYGRAAWQASANDATIFGGDPINKYLVYGFDYAKAADGTYTLNKINLPEYIDAGPNTMRTANTDWFKEISQKGTYQTYDVAVSRGTEKGSTVFSLDYTDNGGIVKTTNFRRISARINTDYKLLKDRLIIGENFTANTTREVQGNTLNAALQALPVIPVRTENGLGWGGPFGGMNDRQNPVRLLQDNKQNHYDYLRMLGNAFADLEIIKGLHARTSFGVDYGNYTLRDMQLAYTSGYLNNPINKVTMVNSNSAKLIWTNTLNYKRSLGKHNFDVLGGTEIYKENAIDFSASRQNFASEDLDYLYLGAGTGLKDNTGGGNEFNLLSYFGKANYSFNDKYLASVTLRYDGSSKFGTNKQFALFPAFNVAWRLDNEDFIKKLDLFSELKLRYGWGQTGSQDPIPSAANRTLYQTNYSGGDPTWRTPDGTAYDLSGNGTGTLPSGYQLTQRSNDDVKWETTTQSNFGLDYGFLNDRIYGSLEYFYKETSDMLIQPAYIGVIGEGGNRWVNGATLQNNGLEFQIGYRGTIGSDLKFDFNGNIASYRNKITSLPEEIVNNFGGNGTTDNILGHPWGSGYGYVADGLFTTQDEVLKSAEQLNKGLGRIRYKDLNGDGSINEKDRTWILNPVADYTYGLNFNFGYKGFDLTMFFQGVGNQQINVYDAKAATDFWSINETGSNKGTRLLDAWTPSNASSTIPALTTTDRNFENRFSTYFIEN
ncbi:MAG: SusC/RagA family TonB-linked outer membrane protein, partial [Daejeonella sp.]|nr:SusC/RagA family TonB-linked outer membrane protein [Daejeonella sp.]